MRAFSEPEMKSHRQSSLRHMQAMLARRVEEAETRTERMYCGSQVPGLAGAVYIPTYCMMRKEGFM